MNTIHELQNQIQQLRSEINNENYAQIVKEMQYLDKQISSIRITELLSNINAKQSRTRNFAKQAWEAEQPAEDVTTNDGSFHKTKVKKYPNLAAIEYARGKYEDGLLTQLNINGEKFTLYEKTYHVGKPCTYTRPETFEKFLEINHIPKENITEAKYAEIGNAIEEANEVLHQQINAYKSKMEELKAYSYLCWEVVTQRSEHLMMYRKK